MINNIFIQLLFGAPAGWLCLMLAALGIWKKWVVALVIAGIWSLPATYYLSAGLGLPLFLTAAFVFGAAFAVYKNKIRIAWLLLVPLLFTTGYMTFITLYTLLNQ